MKHVVVGIISRLNNQDEKEHLLASSKRDFGQFSGFYYPPGGHLEEDEDEVTALAREIREELGVIVNPINKLAETESDIKNQITHWWRCELDDGQKLVIDKTEIADAGWFTKKQMSKMDIWPATKKFFDEYIFNESQ